MQRKSSLEVKVEKTVPPKEKPSLVTLIHQSVGCQNKQIGFLCETICPVVVAVALKDVVVSKAPV